MTIAPERQAHTVPRERPMGLLDIAEMVYREFPGHRVEVLAGQLTVTPPADPPHGDALTDLTMALAPLHGKETRVIQAVGLWLPTGNDDYAVPDLAVVDADHREHVVRFHCVDPAICHLVVEITSSNWADDTVKKPTAYARAGVPVYVVGDRRQGEVIVLSEPRGGEYRARAAYRPGETFTLPGDLAEGLVLEVDAVLGREPGADAG
ncbi:Uma2 family endonuclease [Streptomyces sp. JJ66]|uniref:Uma2 family endonuclease n=1 Tax=Streptomyces sp. JJ66 TaxID=2803843 RepID=UPI001C5614DA|nr:Uma2 family endonuclease [Streptomyces sp. JJ66]MBW1602294.1 Uma2 family endonuclease [Streptomyces sp. JJ66]